MTKPQVIIEADKVARMVFQGIAVSMLVEIPDERVIDGTDYVYGVTDQKRYLVGKPGSRERIEALRSQYEAIAASGEELSPFTCEE